MSDTKKALTQYIKEISTEYKTGTANERTYYRAMQNLIDELSGKRITTQQEPAQENKGILDIVVKRGQNAIGYIEVKNLGMDLDHFGDFNENQFDRNRATYDNLIYTNLLEWRLYRKGIDKPIQAVKIADVKSGAVKADYKLADDFENLITLFLGADPQSIGTTKGLATQLAKLTKVLRRETEKHKDESPFLVKLFNAFKDELIGDLEEGDFADMYAQTITYGIFTARNMNPNALDFDKHRASELLPKTNPFLKKVFKFVTDPDNLEDQMPEEIIAVIDDIAALVKSADMSAINAELNAYEKNRSKRSITEADKDPIIYFYENFLAEYDPQKRKERGVYYTPLPIVGYIVRSIDKILKSELGRPYGLADENVTILDPACGSGTFLYEVLNNIYETIGVRSTADWKNIHVPKLLKRMFGFELLMAPYTIAHFKMAKKLQDTGYEFASNERLGIFLTNTLEEGIKKDEKLDVLGITHEGNEAARVKKDEKVMVILGNPPYRGHSKNQSKWIMDLITDYKAPEETNPRQGDDYVKFIRFAHWKMAQVEKGVIGMITNASFIDGVTHRKMRAELLKEFDEIHIFDLHGRQNYKGDENVFAITINVAITLFIKSGKKAKGADGTVYYHDRYGKDTDKFLELQENDYTTIGDKEVEISAFEGEYAKTRWSKRIPYFKFFAPMEGETVGMTKEYGDAWGMKEIFSEQTSGIKSHGDRFKTGFTKQELLENIKGILNDDEAIIKKLNLKAEHKEEVKTCFSNGIDENEVKPINYRPFDTRQILYNLKFITRHRHDYMRHLIAGENLGLIFCRNQDYADKDNCGLVTDKIEDLRTYSRPGSEGTDYLAPLYLYEEPDKPDLLGGGMVKRTNFKKAFVEFIEKKYSKKPTPEQIFGYIYAVLYSPTYRERYLELLKIDFPRVPFVDDGAVFFALSDLGTRLVDLHTMKTKGWGDYRQLGDADDPTVGKNKDIRYDKEAQEIILDAKRPKVEWVRIGQVPPEVWEYKIGGYQVVDNWLKARSGRRIAIGDLCEILHALTETIRIQREIDEVYIVEASAK